MIVELTTTFCLRQERKRKNYWFWCAFCRRTRKVAPFLAIFLRFSLLIWLLCLILKRPAMLCHLILYIDKVERVMGGRIHIKAFTALWFWLSRTSHLPRISQEQSNGTPHQGVLYTASIISICHCLRWLLGMRRYLHIRTAWGWTLLVSTIRAMREPYGVKRATGLAPRLFFVIPFLRILSPSCFQIQN